MPFPLLPLLGLIGPPLFDLGKKLILGPSKDTPEATMSSLATTKPEVLGPYIEGMSKLREADTKFFNRDVVGAPSQWIVDLRASIRPIVTGMCSLAVLLDAFVGVNLSPEAKQIAWTVVNLWFSNRITNGS